MGRTGAAGQRCPDREAHERRAGLGPGRLPATDQEIGVNPRPQKTRHGAGTEASGDEAIRQQKTARHALSDSRWLLRFM
jgi:hypothetical protein